MSRSKRKMPIAGITTAETEKSYKAAAHRAERRVVRAKVKSGADDIPHTKEFGDPWSGPKDGKYWFRDPTRILRK